MKVQGSITSIFPKGVWARDYYPIISPLLSAHSQHGHFIQPPELLKFFTQNTTPDQNIIQLQVPPTKLFISAHLGKHVLSRHPASTPLASYKLTSSIFADSESQDAQATDHLLLHHAARAHAQTKDPCPDPDHGYVISFARARVWLAAMAGRQRSI